MPRCKYLTTTAAANMPYNISEFPNFSKTGSITGMKKHYYGKDALLVKCGAFIYNVTSQPEIYHQHAY